VAGVLVTRDLCDIQGDLGSSCRGRGHGEH
jgi:hypothetical protein